MGLLDQAEQMREKGVPEKELSSHEETMNRDMAYVENLKSIGCYLAEIRFATGGKDFVQLDHGQGQRAGDVTQNGPLSIRVMSIGQTLNGVKGDCQGCVLRELLKQSHHGVFRRRFGREAIFHRDAFPPLAFLRQ